MCTFMSDLVLFFFLNCCTYSHFTANSFTVDPIATADYAFIVVTAAATVAAFNSRLRALPLPVF